MQIPPESFRGSYRILQIDEPICFKVTPMGLNPIFIAFMLRTGRPDGTM